MTEPVTVVERLRELALDQHGFVTSAQAVAHDIKRAELPRLAARGRLERVAHGVYRVPQVPASRYDNWALAVLWTSADEACLSHETALAAWDISDINPAAIHVTVGTHRRLRRQGGDRYFIHRANLAPTDVTWFESIRITTLPVTIEMCIAFGTPSYLLRQALDRGGRTSLLPASDRVRLAAALDRRDNDA